jgi:cysteine desulfurase
MRRVYLDHNATTPVHPRVRAAMLPFLEDHFGNPSSAHWASDEPRRALAEARQTVASFVGANPHEVVFTSGGSEGDNMALRGALDARPQRGHLVISAVEHPAVLKTAALLESRGAEVTIVPVDAQGMLDPEDVGRAIRPDTALVSVMYANNETGTLLPVREVAAICRERGVLSHTDAVQAVGKMPLDVRDLGVDILTASGHKFNAPKGVGFQYVREGVQLPPLIAGGHQEFGFRAGTENIAGIVALAEACRAAADEMEERHRLIGGLRERLENGLLERLPQSVLNGHPERRVYNTANISFKYIEGEALMALLIKEGIAVSTGSACASGSTEPSHVLTAMNLAPLCSRGAIRFSLGLGTTEEDVAYCMDIIPPLVKRLQRMSPFSA